ncbi:MULTISPECIES: 3-oxoacyl-ACP reductase [Glutamicibacter]|uniref:3-oxoacyl-ACP reductase n=1 Tax=Glutamicibacter halophytocola TaxID=1933880 RepID=A0AA95BSD4_9MICC|nr:MULTISPECIES: 3-oxoacyl-ACP reductase [Glutamicibacter]ALG27857.1 3-ketoacyl-ACP reductase [Glutamicibacter halophytocola]MBF6672007.1 3-oxoacyl-ACP reductase [Glutamicibacter sp. FBE19]NQD42623.1 3-oxoacyl-ACP reductase [Glutamicibacter halophytocola]UUX59367.1 3-oxoacyl-ACP reductase [Glutamicibacter halophytocola]
MSTDTQSPATPIALPLEEQVILVTGGARGLGAAISKAFLAAGAKVVINYNSSEQAANDLVALYPNDAVAIQADVRNESALKSMVAEAEDHFGQPVTTLVNNALVDFSFNGDARSTAEAISAAELSAQFAGSVLAPVAAIQAVLPGMRQTGFGRIINIGTNLFQHPVVPYHDYTATKAALLSLTRTFADDLGPEGINVNMVSGGLLRTTDASAATPEAVFDLIASGTPLRRVTTPAELADTVLFFASPLSRGVTGQNLIVDGGLVKG